MKISNFYAIIAACAAGYMGGLLASQQSVKASAPPEVIRAMKFELVDGSGTPVGAWEFEPGAGVSLRFMFNAKASFVIGNLADGHPFLAMSGRDGKRRIVMELDQSDKPMLGMGDERWEGRVHLGFIPPDTAPYSNWDHWGLLFRARGSEHGVVGMGMTNTENNPAEPFLRIAGKSIR
jgi:hypothetical protein